MQFKKIPHLLMVFPLIYSANVLADDDSFADGYAQFRIGGGVTWLNAQESTIGITSAPFVEVDTLTSSDSDHVAALGTIGIGYVIPFDTDSDEEVKWLPGMILSVDGTYQFESELSGEVYQFSDPAFSNYNYQYGIQNANLLANLTLGLVEYQRWTLFAIGGLGAAWTWIEYQETTNPGETQGNLTLDTGSNTTFAWQAGGGLGYEILPELDATLTYLYTDLGKVQTSSTISSQNLFNGTPYISTTPEFDLSEQSVVLSLQWNFI